MYPWLRLIKTGFSLVGKKQVGLLDTTRITLRAWPNDLDPNIHVNNGRYLMLADLGRMHWFFRTGLMSIARKQRAFPVIGDAIAKFRREIRAFEKFSIESRMVGWDHKWGFLEHRFVRHGRVIGVVAIRGVFKGPKGPVDPNVFLDELSHHQDSPPLPEWATHFHRASEVMSELLRKEEQPVNISSPSVAK
jgi:acyl-CoA thioesterase FadM